MTATRDTPRDRPPYEGPLPVAASIVRPLRQQVLRPGQPEEASCYEGDDADGALHLAVFVEGEAVACGSIFRESGWRIRGMATLPRHRGFGLGGLVLDGLLRRAADGGGGRVWCNARTTVRGFYEASGFTAAGDIFELPGLGPHVRMSREV